jgi:hypothetical protein
MMQIAAELAEPIDRLAMTAQQAWPHSADDEIARETRS